MGLGSNLGDREANLRHALELLGKSMALERISSIYDTEPWGYQDQPRFLNCACAARTSLPPGALLTAVKDVERTVGREPTTNDSVKWGPRLLDVDILFYGRRVVKKPGLEIPHPRLTERAFVLVPLKEIASDYLHPVLRLSVAELLVKLTGGQSGVGGLPEGVVQWGAPIPVS